MFFEKQGFSPMDMIGIGCEHHAGNFMHLRWDKEVGFGKASYNGELNYESEDGEPSEDGEQSR